MAAAPPVYRPHTPVQQPKVAGNGFPPARFSPAAKPSFPAPVRPVFFRPAPPVARKTVQRYIGLSIDTVDDIVYAKPDGERPSGKGGSQGDHTTPYVTLEHQIANAINEVKRADAWTNLKDTFAVYKTLPGWDDSDKWVTVNLANELDGLLAAGGNIDKMQYAVDKMLTLRNQMAYTSLPKGGTGNGESKWAGSLHYQERQFQLGKTPALAEKDVLDYAWKAFDHRRIEQQGDAKRQKIYEQHARTMVDSYPLLNNHLSVTRVKMKKHRTTKTATKWHAYKPK